MERDTDLRICRVREPMHQRLAERWRITSLSNGGFVENSMRLKCPLAVCPSCGMRSDDSPHATSGDCIRALEAEIERLMDLLDHVKQHSPRRPGP